MEFLLIERKLHLLTSSNKCTHFQIQIVFQDIDFISGGKCFYYDLQTNSIYDPAMSNIYFCIAASVMRHILPSQEIGLARCPFVRN